MPPRSSTLYKPRIRSSWMGYGSYGNAGKLWREVEVDATSPPRHPPAPPVGEAPPDVIPA